MTNANHDRLIEALRNRAEARFKTRHDDTHTNTHERILTPLGEPVSFTVMPRVIIVDMDNEQEAVEMTEQEKASIRKVYQLTPSQNDALKSAIEQHNQSAHDQITESILVRTLLAEWCEKHGYDFPETQITQGIRTDL